MELFENNENKNPKSLNRLAFNSSFGNYFSIKNQKFETRTPLIQLDNKDNKCLQYSLLKSISSSKINLIHNIISNNIDNKYYHEDEKYNENALEDEPKDFMHMNENKIYINNNIEYYEANLNQSKVNTKFENILDNNLISVTSGCSVFIEGYKISARFSVFVRLSCI